MERVVSVVGTERKSTKIIVFEAFEAGNVMELVVFFCLAANGVS